MKITFTYFSKSILLFVFSLTTVFSGFAQVSDYAGLPYYNGFESGALDSNWYTVSSMPTGRIQIWPSDTLIWGGDTAMAIAGNYFLGMDMPQSGTLNLNQAWLGINADGFSGLYLSFWWNDWNDETSPEDGIYLSNDSGNTFVKVLDLLGGSNPDLNWVFYNLNLDSINNVHGLTYTSSYVIKFQQYDDYYLAGGNDGFMFDEISVGPVITATKSNKFNFIRVFPNPTENELNVSGLNIYSLSTLNIKNSLGQILYSEYSEGLPAMSLNLDLTPGIYFLEIIDINGVTVKEFIKR